MLARYPASWQRQHKTVEILFSGFGTEATSSVVSRIVYNGTQ